MHTPSACLTRKSLCYGVCHLGDRNCFKSAYTGPFEPKHFVLHDPFEMMRLAGLQKLVLMSNLSSTVFSVFFGLSNSYWWAASVRFAQGFFNWCACTLAVVLSALAFVPAVW